MIDYDNNHEFRAEDLLKEVKIRLTLPALESLSAQGKGEVRYVGVTTGMNSLIRPALYGAHHEILNLTRLDDLATEVVNVVGPICESGDTLGTDRLLPPTQEGDVLLIATAGAYGRAMSSTYNLREPAKEFLI